jgi:hypothetical protein
MILLSITGVFRTLLIILGVLVVLRVVGRMMVAQRNAEEEKEHLRKQRESEKMVANAKQNFGKTVISHVDKKKADDAGYTDFEEVRE